MEILLGFIGEDLCSSALLVALAVLLQDNRFQVILWNAFGEMCGKVIRLATNPPSVGSYLPYE